nr:divergent PAP2 family protein [Paenibacillus taihuensis]
MLTALIAIVAAQTLKIPINLLTKRTLDLKIAVSTGGMPSSHSAAVCSLAASIGLADGFHSSMFALAVLFSVITMYDAMGIRRHAGTHATILNRIIRLFPAHSKELQEEGTLKEMLGHRPIEVCAGAVLGVVIGLLMN